MTSAGIPKPEPSVRVSCVHAECGKRCFDAVPCGRTLAGAVEPHKVRLFAKPDQLSSRIAAILLRDERTGGGLVAHAVEHLQDLSIHESAEGTRIRGHARREQTAHLLDHTAGK